MEISTRTIASTSEISDKTADVVVIGGGAAGLFAAVEAADLGADVVLLEK